MTIKQDFEAKDFTFVYDLAGKCLLKDSKKETKDWRAKSRKKLLRAMEPKLGRGTPLPCFSAMS